MWIFNVRDIHSTRIYSCSENQIHDIGAIIMFLIRT